MVERQTPNLRVGGSNPSWPATLRFGIFAHFRVWIVMAVNKAVQFLRDVHSELSKVVWPRFDEFFGSTIIVLVVMALFSVYLGLVDWIFVKIIKYIFALYGGY